MSCPYVLIAYAEIHLGPSFQPTSSYPQFSQSVSQ